MTRLSTARPSHPGGAYTALPAAGAPHPTARAPRIAVLVSVFPALSESFVLEQLLGLHALGAQVDVYALHRSDEPLASGGAVGDALLQRLRVPGAPPRSRWRRWPGLATTVTRELLAGPHRPTSPSELRERLADVRETLAWRYAPAMPPPRYDALHCHYGTLGLLGVRLRAAGVLRARRVVTTFHGNDMSAALRHYGPRVYARLFRDGDLFLPVSDFWLERLLALGAPPARTRVHRMGIDLLAFAHSPVPPAVDGVVRLLSVARLVPKKGLDDALRAVALLRARGLPVRYTIIGAGPERERLLALRSALGLEAAVELAGAQPPAVVRQALAAAHILVAPSRTAADGDMEGLPVAIMEACAVGRPVMATRHSGIPELVADGVCGRLVPEGDWTALADALAELAAAPERWAAMGAAGRRRVEAAFDARQLNAALLARLAPDDAGREPRGAALTRS